MKTFIISVILLLALNSGKAQTVNFTDYFENRTMRVDYIHAGNNAIQNIYLEQIKDEPIWGGSKKNLIDPFNYGIYKVSVFDSISGSLIYSRGYCSLFQEWQATPEAKKVNRSFYETVVFPYPKKTVKMEISVRNKKDGFDPVFTMFINPADYFIKEEMEKVNCFKLYNSGDPDKCLDVVIIPEGYTKEEMEKFKIDAKKFAGYILETEPFKEYSGRFNFWGLEAPSLESGTDIPGENIWKNTVVSSNFYTFDSERYLTTQDIKSVRDLAANAPYDQIYILVNTDKYGGGGIYNHYNLCVSDNVYSKEVFLHEFGHGLCGLGDEYYTSDVSVEDYYSPDVEPWEPNITNMVNFEKKWKAMIKKDVPVPTPAEEKYEGTIGAFEGAGYCAKGMYRPYLDCIMISLGAKEGFCPVCRKALVEMIKFYTE